jgi:hypothetical protein
MRLETDEMIAFAVTTLDWGTGIVLVPQAWREVVGTAAVKWNIDDIRDAVRPKLSAQTRENHVRLLYRHAFVHLFNHLERIAELEGSGVIEVKDLGSFDWLAHEILCWRYAPDGEARHFFKPAMDNWYSNSSPYPLLERICAKFPKSLPAPLVSPLKIV